MTPKYKKDLEALGFVFKDKVIEDDFSYQDAIISKNDSQLCITTEFDEDGKYRLHYVDFNCQTLKGRGITLNDLKLLIELM
ncbi:MAG: hypothetical protein AAF717_00210 [Bacteroidota bacterium]